MEVYSKKLLMKKASVTTYTLTVSLNPASATCTLTYDGIAHTATSATVDAGTIISYSVYHSTYGTTTGTITMDANKTLTCTGTYSQTSTDVSWSQPTVSTSSSSNTSITTSGGTIYSCQMVRSASYPLSNAFDGSTSGNTACPIEYSTEGYTWIQIYNPTALKASNVTVYWSPPGSASNTATIKIEASNNGSSWTTLSSGNTSSGSGLSTVITKSISLSTSNYYNYYKISNTTPYMANNRCYWYIRELKLTAKYKTTSYTYYWDTSIT